MHTPRLCIDARAATEFPFQGLVAQEAIDQLILANGEGGIASEWIEKNRTVLFSHGEQVFSGQLKRFNTRVKMGKTPIHWAYEQSFIKKAQVSGLHEFRPVDKLLPSLNCPTITTLLPPKKSLPFIITRRNQHRYVVPSKADAKLLKDRYEIPETQTLVFRPFVRRYTHFSQGPKQLSEGWFLFLTDSKMSSSRLKEMIGVLTKRYPSMVPKILRLDRVEVAPVPWTQLLEKTQALFYLTALPFDWGTLALESIYWGIPTLFLDENACIEEQLPKSPLKLSRFLVDAPSLSTLKQSLLAERTRLEDSGAFDPSLLARQYRDVFEHISPLN